MFLRRQHYTKRTQGYGPWQIYDTTGQGMGPFFFYAAADIAGAIAIGRASVIRISRSVPRRCASVGLCAGALCACCMEGPIGAPARPRTRRSRWRPGLGPHVHAARAGSPLAGRGCTGDQRLSAWPARGQTPAAVRTRFRQGSALRGATAALGPRADFLSGPCSATAPAQAC
jgi:hypothetical protein